MSLALVQFFILDPWKQHRVNLLATSEFDTLTSKPPSTKAVETSNQSVPVFEMKYDTFSPVY